MPRPTNQRSRAKRGNLEEDEKRSDGVKGGTRKKGGWVWENLPAGGVLITAMSSMRTPKRGPDREQEGKKQTKPSHGKRNQKRHLQIE